MHRHDLAEGAARHIAILADALDQIKAARLWLGRGFGAQPAQDLLRIGQIGENRGRRGRDLGLAPDDECFGHQFIPGSTQEMAAARPTVKAPVIEDRP
jgi:hypothetical protein